MARQLQASEWSELCAGNANATPAPVLTTTNLSTACTTSSASLASGAHVSTAIDCSMPGSPAHRRPATSSSHWLHPSTPAPAGRVSRTRDVTPSHADREQPEGGAGDLGRLAASGDWKHLFHSLAQRNKSTFVTGGPGVGKSTFLKGFHQVLVKRWRRDGNVVIVAPTGSSAKTANGQTYHSFFGFPREYRPQVSDSVAEAGRLLKQDRFRFISRRLAAVRVLLMDEVSMVAADIFSVMWELLRQSRGSSSPCVIYCFGDFLQLGPLRGDLAVTAGVWRDLFGRTMLELTRVYRQCDPGLVQAIHDARFGDCTPSVMSLMDECSVSDDLYNAIKSTVLHIMPRHEDVQRHNVERLMELCLDAAPIESLSEEDVKEDKDRDQGLPAVDLRRVTVHSRDAALSDCVAPTRVLHCVGARVMLTNNQVLKLGLFHDSIGRLTAYKDDGTPDVHFDDHALNAVPAGVRRGMREVHDAGED